MVERLPAEDESSLVREMVAHFTKRGVKTFSWWVTHDVDFESWAAALQAHGFGVNNSTPGMAMPLANLPEAAPLPQDFTIQAVSEEGGLRTWAHVFCAGFGLPESVADPYFELLAGLGFNLPWRHYLGILRREPVATSSVFLSNGVAGIYNVAVLPEARRSGLGAALTLEPLREARQMGCNLSALQSSEMGYRVYQRLGYRQVSTIRNCYWSADEAKSHLVG
jgi:ribosomal protein S18 acetylase RimI-like enzyme